MPRTYALDKRLAEQREREQTQHTAAKPQKLTRSEIAKKAAQARWHNRRKRDEEISRTR